MSTASAPVEIGRVALTVRDIGAVAAFYETVIGLRPLASDGGLRRLGAGGRVLLELRADPAARPADPRAAGLFHTAFLLPSRADLGAWLRHVAGARVPLQGASDHLVSEAIYLADPEGNGIEVYVDRPRADWPREGGRIRMATEPLDLPALASAARTPWAGAPEGTVVGHVHLQVGAVAAAEEFYSGRLGFDLVTHYPGAAFFSSGGYHHHLATNVWNSRGAGRRSEGAAGLAGVELLAGPEDHDRLAAALAASGGTDPWGTPVSVAAKPA
ncbi:VOC family protein [Albidovulum sp.]|jgi:catechol 2,3-dioxygenase|uniref:VOC family protein n=1 Tax=Albidovulum sp. TaxID=1872424 RepID=UPI00304F41A3